MDYNARYYSPVLGRFISPDSIVLEPGSSGGFNRYRYARNNPLRYTDPSGHIECGGISECTPPDYQTYRNRNPSFEEQAQIMENINTVNQVGIAIWTVPVVTAIAPEAVIPMLSNGVIGEAGYTGSVFFENRGNGKNSLDGWNMGDGVASFLTGEASLLIPGSGTTSSFVRGAVQNAGAYALGKVFNNETPNFGITTLNAVTGGFASGGADKALTSKIAASTLNKVGPGAAALARSALPILSSAVTVGSQNAIVQKMSNEIERIKPAISDPLGVYAKIFHIFHHFP